jgi:hypothetical protein
MVMGLLSDKVSRVDAVDLEVQAALPVLIAPREALGRDEFRTRRSHQQVFRMCLKSAGFSTYPVNKASLT